MDRIGDLEKIFEEYSSKIRTVLFTHPDIIDGFNLGKLDLLLEEKIGNSFLLEFQDDAGIKAEEYNRAVVYGRFSLLYAALFKGLDSFLEMYKYLVKTYHRLNLNIPDSLYEQCIDFGNANIKKVYGDENRIGEKNRAVEYIFDLREQYEFAKGLLEKMPEEGNYFIEFHLMQRFIAMPKKLDEPVIGIEDDGLMLITRDEDAGLILIEFVKKALDERFGIKDLSLY